MYNGWVMDFWVCHLSSDPIRESSDPIREFTANLEYVVTEQTYYLKKKHGSLHSTASIQASLLSWGKRWSKKQDIGEETFGSVKQLMWGGGKRGVLIKGRKLMKIGAC